MLLRAVIRRTLSSQSSGGAKLANTELQSLIEGDLKGNDVMVYMK